MNKIHMLRSYLYGYTTTKSINKGARSLVVVVVVVFVLCISNDLSFDLNLHTNNLQK